MTLRVVWSVAVAAALGVVRLSAQSSAWQGTPANNYQDRFREIWNVQPSNQAADVTGLTLRRGGTGEIVLEHGKLYLLNPIGGQVMGAVFRGTGHFNFSAPLAIEQERLKLFRDKAPIAEPFTKLVLLFADSTLAELTRQLTFQATDIPSEVKGLPQDAFNYIGDEGQKVFLPDIMDAFLNGRQTGFFYAHMDGDGFSPWMLWVNPADLESVRFRTRSKRTDFTHYAQTLAQFAIGGDTIRTGGRSERKPGARIGKYTIAVRLPSSGGGVGFEAAATMAITADTTVGPWVPFYLFDELIVDSARWETGEPAMVYKGDKSPDLWVRLDRPLAPKEFRALKLYYHGDLLRRAADLFFLKSSIAWYPVALDSRLTAPFDLTFESPEGMSLASVGDRVDSTSAPGHMIRTHWVTPGAIRNASFTLGVFDQFDVKEQGVPPVTVLWSEATHRWIAQQVVDSGGTWLSGKNMKDQVAQDISNAMRFYEHVYGEAPVKHFYATEIPDFHGEAWPGIVGLSYVTFHQTDLEGEDQVFRAHEVAHQWWGIAVDYATYRDRWLSEGLADFSGLWYLQTRRQDNKLYFNMLDRWKTGLMLRRDEPLSIWLGHRVVRSGHEDDYDMIIYKKGAWVFHMLRMLLIDLRNMDEARFTSIMHDFYSTYSGGAASTADFERVVERGTGQDMSWFFRQWVYGWGIPTFKVAQRIEPTPDGKFKVTLRVDQENVPPDFLSYVPVTLDLGKDQVARVRVKVTGARSEISLPPVAVKPREVRFDDMDGVLAEVKEVGW